MTKILATLALLTTASIAHADYTCTVRANGRAFTETENTQREARRDVTRECLRATASRWDRECSRNVNCRNVGNRHDDDMCYVAQTRRWMEADDFFQYASSQARRTDKCVVASFLLRGQSTRYFDDNGRRVNFIRGGTNSCQRLTCIRVNH